MHKTLNAALKEWEQLLARLRDADESNRRDRERDIELFIQKGIYRGTLIAGQHAVERCYRVVGTVNTPHGAKVEFQPYPGPARPQRIPVAEFLSYTTCEPGAQPLFRIVAPDMAS